MRHDLSLTARMVTLRPLAQEDLEELRILRNRSSERFIHKAQIGPEEQRRWYHSYLDREGDYMFSVYHRSNGAWVGAVGIYDVDAGSGTAEFGRLIVDRVAAGTGGLGAEATRAACAIAFSQLHLERLRLEVYHDNVAALIAYLKAGFLPVEMAEDGAGGRLLRMELVRSKEADL